MNWDDEDHRIALRIATISTWGFEQALEALKAGGEARENALSLLRRRERTQRVLDEVAELRQASERPRWFGFL
jgi:hypothetical protein